MGRFHASSHVRRGIASLAGLGILGKGESADVFATLFAAELEPIREWGKDNALIMRGIILDIEHSTSSPEGIPAIFPELQMVLYSSFNHTEESPRYRICIPTTHFVTPQINEVIGWTIARVRSGHTVWIPANSTAPPCSIVPITAPRCS